MNRPIGLFDSGIGGLTVLKEVLTELPDESYVYFGDTARVPYGNKSKDTITRFSMQNVQFLQSLDVKLCVVACHTASSLSLRELQERFYPMPMIGVIEPAARKAVEVSRGKRVGVIGTKATISSGAFEAELKRIDKSVRVFSTACPLFVPLVEEGWTSGEIVEKTARTYLEPLRDFGIDTLILGCTHYPVLAEAIGAVLPGVELVNAARETAHEAAAVLNRMGARASAGERHDLRLFVSDEPEHFRQMGERFFGRPIGSVVKISADSYAGAAR